MNKKYILFGITILNICMLCGCGNKIPDMTEEQQALVCEYAAQLLISHDKFHDSSVVDVDTIEKEKQKLENAAQVRVSVEAEKEAKRKEKEEKEKEKENSKKDKNEETSVNQDFNISEFLGLSGVDIKYAGYQISDSYPFEIQENDWQGICTASKGNKLVVFNFDVINNSGSDYNLDMASMDTHFSFKMNGNISKAALTTMLSDDLIMYRNIIPSGDSAKTIIVVEMSENDASSLNSVVMRVKYNGNIAQKTLL